ncbi:GATA transcription factor 16-like [Cucurbita pepo subsp. pepo]|uniref:GATA transcription factor 16-like n=1 Tax=Cucurbita pepo subsp. pepo TaxID=3664 RepID=UPI000C9D9498|nr:GATA transcription factor 16-like [Cucurbita pepo subsp. pepo]
MMDPIEEGSEFKDAENSPRMSSPAESEQNKKTCADCGTTKTPLWRGGPAGPKSLCNACGIRSRKKRRSLLGLNRGSEVERKSKGSSNRNSNGGGNQAKLGGDNLKWRSTAFGRKDLMQRRQLGEEEQAAVLLMALSYGSVYA